MGQRKKQGFLNAISLVELLLGATASWLVGKTLGFLWKNLKRLLRLREGKRSNVKDLSMRLLNGDIRLLAFLLELHPAEVKFCMYSAKTYGFFKGGLRGLTELIMYSFRTKENSF